MNNTPTVAEVVDKLQAQGSAGQIADFLAGEGVAGIRTVPQICPVANYVRRETGVSVLVDHQRVIEAGSFTDGSLIAGTPISDFVTGFDAGHYPQLDANQ